MLVDDHAVVRHGIAFFLQSFEDMEVVAQASSGEEAVSLCHSVLPDIVLMDLLMPGMGGVEATGIIRERFPAIQVVAMTSYDDEALVRAILQAGAIGYLLKDATSQELGDTIRAAHAGKPSLSPGATQILIASATQPPPHNYHLTEREIEVLSLLVEGLNNPQIAQRLVISRSTVKYHVSSILSKLGVASRTEAVAMAVQNNLVNVDTDSR
ncbi:MAG: response regulator transcription factor [Chloroflexi bacterium]|nr:response regulator transcription factor [Chloroflexota bacterium]